MYIALSLSTVVLDPLSEVISTQNSQAVKKDVAFKGLSEQSCEIKGGCQEIAPRMFVY